MQGLITTEVKKILHDMARDLTQEYQNRLVNGNKASNYQVINASGNLYNSVNFVVNIDSNNMGYELEFKALDYWQYIEYGRRAGGKMPNITAIMEWIKIKPIYPRQQNLTTKLDIVKAQKQMAFAIAKSIQNRGITPKPILQSTVDSILNEYRDRIQKSMAKDVQISAVKILKEEFIINKKGVATKITTTEDVTITKS